MFTRKSGRAWAPSCGAGAATRARQPDILRRLHHRREGEDTPTPGTLQHSTPRSNPAGWPRRAGVATAPRAKVKEPPRQHEGQNSALLAPARQTVGWYAIRTGALVRHAMKRSNGIRAQVVFGRGGGVLARARTVAGAADYPRASRWPRARARGPVKSEVNSPRLPGPGRDAREVAAPALRAVQRGREPLGGMCRERRTTHPPPARAGRSRPGSTGPRSATGTTAISRARASRCRSTSGCPRTSWRGWAAGSSRSRWLRSWAWGRTRSWCRSTASSRSAAVGRRKRARGRWPRRCSPMPSSSPEPSTHRCGGGGVQDRRHLRQRRHPRRLDFDWSPY